MTTKEMKDVINECHKFFNNPKERHEKCDLSTSSWTFVEANINEQQSQNLVTASSQSQESDVNTGENIGFLSILLGSFLIWANIILAIILGLLKWISSGSLARGILSAIIWWILLTVGGYILVTFGLVG